jgi:hypothetical protein
MQADQDAQSAAAIVTTNRQLAYLVNERSARLDLAGELIDRWIEADKAGEWHKTMALAAAIHGVVEDLDNQTRMAHPAVAEFFGLPH